jgi:hypothetical protein
MHDDKAMQSKKSCLKHSRYTINIHNSYCQLKRTTTNQTKAQMQWMQSPVDFYTTAYEKFTEIVSHSTSQLTSTCWVLIQHQEKYPSYWRGYEDTSFSNCTFVWVPNLFVYFTPKNCIVIANAEAYIYYIYTNENSHKWWVYCKWKHWSSFLYVRQQHILCARINIVRNIVPNTVCRLMHSLWKFSVVHVKKRKKKKERKRQSTEILMKLSITQCKRPSFNQNVSLMN